MYVRISGGHVPRFFRLEKRQAHNDQEITCFDVYALCTMLPLATVSTTCLYAPSYVAVSLLWAHCVYEVVHRVRFNTVCTFPHAFTVIYVACAGYIAVAMCIHSVFAGFIQCFVSTVMIVRYFILQHSTRAWQGSHTPL